MRSELGNRIPNEPGSEASPVTIHSLGVIAPERGPLAEITKNCSSPNLYAGPRRHDALEDTFSPR